MLSRTRKAIAARFEALAEIAGLALSLSGAAIASLLALVEAGVVVEAVDLPVRFHQPGFAFHHWLIVAVAVLAATWLQRRLLRSARDAVSSRRRP